MRERLPVDVALVKNSVGIVCPPVVEALVRLASPDREREVPVALVKYREGTVIPVVDALVILANVEYRLVAVSPVDDAKVAIRFVVEARVENKLIAVNPAEDEAILNCN